MKLKRSNLLTDEANSLKNNILDYYVQPFDNSPKLIHVVWKQGLGELYKGVEN